jgi:hypothetical protein
MSTATESSPMSLAERIAKVRNRMLVATVTKVPPSNKELFVAVCQVYEQHDMERSSLSSEAPSDFPPSLQELVLVHKTQENARQYWPEYMLTKKLFLGQVSQEWAEDFSDNIGGEDWGDWNKQHRTR